MIIAIEAREKPSSKSKKEQEIVAGKTENKKKGHPKKGEERSASEPNRIEKQRTMDLVEMLDDLPTGRSNPLNC